MKATIYLYNEFSFTIRNWKSDVKLPQAETLMLNVDSEQIREDKRMSKNKPTERFTKHLVALFILKIPYHLIKIKAW
jgi:hypothetical protein